MKINFVPFIFLLFLMSSVSHAASPTEKCQARQLRAAAALCSSLLVCESSYVKNIRLTDKRTACINKAQSKFNNLISKAIERSFGSCTLQASGSSIGTEWTATINGNGSLAETILSGWDASNTQSNKLYRDLLKAAASHCSSSLVAYSGNAIKPDQGKLSSALVRSRNKLLTSTIGKILKAEAKGFDYVGKEGIVIADKAKTVIDHIVAQITDSSSLPTTADLSVTLTGNPQPAIKDTDLTYTITATNQGPDTAMNVVIADTIPGEVTNVRCSGCGACSIQGSILSCPLGDIESGASQSWELTVQPSVTGKLSNTVHLASATYDPNSSNNMDTAIITVNAPSSSNILANTPLVGTWVEPGLVYHIPNRLDDYVTMFTIKNDGVGLQLSSYYRPSQGGWFAYANTFARFDFGWEVYDNSLYVTYPVSGTIKQFQLIQSENINGALQLTFNVGGTQRILYQCEVTSSYLYCPGIAFYVGP